MQQDTQAKSPSRREFVITTLGMLALAGCGTSSSYLVDERPGPLWPEPAERPKPITRPTVVRGPVPATPARSAHTPAPTRRSNVSFDLITRDRWAKAAPIQNRLNPLGSVTQITIHHEGWDPVNFTDVATTASRLELIRQSHLQRMTAGDIGYHFVIDRAGQVWEGRSLAYQGAHVKNHNENNLGIMVLGNFDLQAPSDAQTLSLQTTLSHLMRQHRVHASRVYTHQELNPTRCPGVQLQSRMSALRTARRIG